MSAPEMDQDGSVELPVQPPLEPMLAKAQAKVPPEAGGGPTSRNWDGLLH